MKTLTLIQPWATLVAISAKRIETRSWGTRYRGPVAIHAAKGLSSVGGHSGLIDLCLDEPFASALANGGVGLLVPGYNLPLGAVLATAVLFECIQIKQHHDPAGLALYEAIGAQHERDFGDYRVGRWLWGLRDVVPLPAPVPARGSLGLWDWEPAA